MTDNPSPASAAEPAAETATTPATAPAPTTAPTPAPATLLDVVMAFFDKNNWVYARHETETSLQMRYQGENGDWLCNVRAREDAGQLLFYSVLPISVPAKKRGVVAEYLTRVNFNLLIGNFEMDFADGEVLFRTYCVLAGARDLSTETLGYLIFSNLFMMDKYLPGLLAVMSYNITPEAALRQVMEAPAEAAAT